MKKREKDFPTLTEASLARIRHIATLPPPISNGVFLKKEMEEWKYSTYMYSYLKDSYYKQIDEERERKRTEKELARLKVIEIAKEALQRQEDEKREAIEVKRKEELKETFQEMEDIVREIRDTD